MKIRLFINPYCDWCQKAMRWLDDHHIKYEKIDVIADDAGFDEMVRISGQELATVEYGGYAWMFMNIRDL